jgi:hypothetical protein
MGIYNTRMNKIESVAENRQKIQHWTKGTGLFEYRNRSSGTLTLPKSIRIKGREIKEIEKNGTWEGDSYFQILVRQGLASLVRVIVPEDAPVVLPQTLNVIKEGTEMSEDKLLLEQPDTVKTTGKVEQVVANANANAKKIEKPKSKNEEVLLNDDPLSGVQILG